MKNSIADYPVPLVFKLIGRRRSSGELAIACKEGGKRLFFSQGRLDRAASDCSRERLVEMLMLKGILSRDQTVKIKTRISHGENVKIGKLLVREGFMSEKRLYECLIEQATMIAANSFGLTEGEWEFRPAPQPDPDIPALRISLPKIIVKGVQEIRDFSPYRGMFTRSVLKAARLLEKVKKLLTPFEANFLDLIAVYPGETVNRIISALPFANEICWREIMKLYLLNGLEFIDTDMWASNTETMIKSQVDIGKPREAPVAPVKIQRQEKERETTILTEDGKTQPSLPSTDEGLPAFSLEASSSQRSANVIYRMAERLYGEAKYREAALVLHRAVRPETSPAAHILLLGLCQARMPQMQEEAEFHLKIAAEKDAGLADPLFALGDLYRTQGKAPQALEAYYRAMAIYQAQVQPDKTKAETEPPRKKKLLFPLRKK